MFLETDSWRAAFGKIIGWRARDGDADGARERDDERAMKGR